MPTANSQLLIAALAIDPDRDPDIDARDEEESIT